MRMNAVLASLAAIVAFGISPAAAGDTQSRAVQKMIAARGTAPAIPTGIDVPGCTHYKLTLDGRVKQFCDLTAFGDGPETTKEFWEDRARRFGGGSDSGAAGDVGASE